MKYVKWRVVERNNDKFILDRDVLEFPGLTVKTPYFATNDNSNDDDTSFQVPTKGALFADNDLAIGIYDNKTKLPDVDNFVMIPETIDTANYLTENVANHFGKATTISSSSFIGGFVGKLTTTRGKISLVGVDPGARAYCGPWWNYNFNSAIPEIVSLLKAGLIEIDPTIIENLKSPYQTTMKELITSVSKPDQKTKNYLNFLRDGYSLSEFKNPKKYSKSYFNDWLEKSKNAKAFFELRIQEIDRFVFKRFSTIINGLVQDVIESRDNSRIITRITLNTSMGNLTIQIYRRLGFAEKAAISPGQRVNLGLRSKWNDSSIYSGEFTVLPAGSIDYYPGTYRSPTRRIPSKMYNLMVWEFLLREALWEMRN